MAIDLQALYDDKVRQFGVQSNSARFSSDFIASINLVQRELANRLDKDSAYAKVTSLSTACGVEDEYEPALVHGLDAELWRRGHQAGADFSQSYQLYRKALDDAYSIMMRTASNDAEDDEADIIGLGYIDDSAGE